MLEWLYNNMGNILILLGVAVIVALAIIVMIRDKKAGKSSCGCNCANCAMAGKCHSNVKPKKS